MKRKTQNALFSFTPGFLRGHQRGRYETKRETKSPRSGTKTRKTETLPAPMIGDVISALRNLGYKRPTAEASAREAAKRVGSSNFDALLREALRSMINPMKVLIRKRGGTFEVLKSGRVVKRYSGPHAPSNAYAYAKRLEQKRNPVTSYLVVRTRNSQQEWYESKSGDARRRARGLRKLGFKVHVSAGGPQVTPAGRVNMTLVTIDHQGREVPPPDRIERFNPYAKSAPVAQARVALKRKLRAAGIAIKPDASTRELYEALKTMKKNSHRKKRKTARRRNAVRRKSQVTFPVRVTRGQARKIGLWLQSHFRPKGGGRIRMK